MDARGVLVTTPAVRAAWRLRDELACRDVRGQVHGGYGLALVLLWADLVVWTDGMVYRWWTGRMSPRTGRRLYVVYGVHDLAATVRGVVLRYADLYESGREVPVR